MPLLDFLFAIFIRLLLSLKKAIAAPNNWAYWQLAKKHRLSLLPVILAMML